jgi:hypothetical protein
MQMGHEGCEGKEGRKDMKNVKEGRNAKIKDQRGKGRRTRWCAALLFTTITCTNNCRQHNPGRSIQEMRKGRPRSNHEGCEEKGEMKGTL